MLAVDVATLLVLQFWKRQVEKVLLLFSQQFLVSEMVVVVLVKNLVSRQTLQNCHVETLELVIVGWFSDFLVCLVLAVGVDACFFF